MSKPPREAGQQVVGWPIAMEDKLAPYRCGLP